MKVEMIRNSNGLRTKAAAALLALATVATPGAFARAGSGEPAVQPANIVAHVEFAGGPASAMKLEKKNGKQVLYIGLGSAQGLEVVDVTTPERPGAIGQSGGTQRAPKLAAARLAADSPDILALLKATGANAQQGHEFSGSARFVTDARRGLIYVVDGDGLWIVKAKESVGDYTAPYDNTDYGTVYGG